MNIQFSGGLTVQRVIPPSLEPSEQLEQEKAAARQKMTQWAKALEDCNIPAEPLEHTVNYGYQHPPETYFLLATRQDALQLQALRQAPFTQSPSSVPSTNNPIIKSAEDTVKEAIQALQKALMNAVYQKALRNESDVPGSVLETLPEHSKTTL